jgi:hypothetical protein
VRRGLRLDVTKRDAVIVLVDDIRVDLVIDDFLKQRFFRHGVEGSRDRSENRVAAAI